MNSINVERYFIFSSVDLRGFIVGRDARQPDVAFDLENRLALED